MHGCFTSGNSKYYKFPITAGLRGCFDDSVSLDHRDPSHPVRNIMKSTHEMRENYPVLNDGFALEQLSKQTHDVFLPGSNKTTTETGMWSMERAAFLGAQDSFNQTVWLTYSNDQVDNLYKFGCKDDTALVAPFAAGTTVQNLYAPYDKYTLEESSTALPSDPSKKAGCLSQLAFPAWGFKAFVPEDEFIVPTPVITKFLPGHDARILSKETIPIEFHFSVPMDCDQITDTLSITSSTAANQTVKLDSVQCNDVSGSDVKASPYSGGADTTWIFAANLINVADGIHQITINNISSADGTTTTKVCVADSSAQGLY